MGTWLADRSMVLLALISGLILGITFAAMMDEYEALARGEHVTGTVVSVEPHRSYMNGEEFQEPELALSEGSRGVADAVRRTAAPRSTRSW